MKRKDKHRQKRGTPPTLKIRKTFLWTLQSFTIGTCGCDEGHHLGMTKNGTKASRDHNHIKELKWVHINVIGSTL